MSKQQRDIGARFEREVAKLFGVRRNLRADYSESACDVETEQLMIEAKYRASIMVVRWLEQATRYAENSIKTPVVIARERGENRPIAILWADDFLEILNERSDA